MKYQFKCPECQMTDEVEAPIEQGPPYTPACLLCSLFAPQGAPMVYMKRVWSAVPAIFRGGGWASKS